jgi:hypothetical protein
VRSFDKQSYYVHDHYFLVKYKGQKIKINDVRITKVGVQRSDHLVIEINMNIKTYLETKQTRKEGRK